jgi:hypothetical protein
MTVPGHWLERYCPECPAASYNIILDGTDERGVDYAVEYDVRVALAGTLR